MSDIPDFTAWMDQGVERGWVSEPFCGTHDAYPYTSEELDWIEEGDDPCLTLVRVHGPNQKPASDEAT